MADKLAKSIEVRLARLSKGQLKLVNSILDTFTQPMTATRNPGSDVVSQEFLVAFGDILKLHHSLSDDYLDKYRFEAAMERVFRVLGRNAHRPDNRCFPGHDITVDEVAWSLKTHGDKHIRSDSLHISKFMELGRGKWENEADLGGLRDRFLDHMKAYARIFQLRYFALENTPLSPKSHHYELIEIPKRLMLEAATGEITMQHNSTQTPKPGYCAVYDHDGQVKYKLYFDGGTERKLQIKHLQKRFCVFHANWEF